MQKSAAKVERFQIVAELNRSNRGMRGWHESEKRKQFDLQAATKFPARMVLSLLPLWEKVARSAR
jgi:hypothetical protein